MVDNNNNNHAQDLTSETVSIQPRKMAFPFQQMKASCFFDNNTLKSAFVAALSSTFPPGEAEFIASVRNYRNQITDPELKEQIRGFIGQEGHHSHQHKQANLALRDLGWDAARLEAALQRELDKRTPRLSRKFRLAMTVGMEHLTAIIAEHVLENTHKLEHMEPAARELLYWHAVEEIEHKAVAFDVYMQCVGDQNYLRKVLKIGRALFVVRIAAYMVAMMWWARKWPSWREMKEFRSFLWGKDGMLTALKQPFRDYFKPGFHPWDHANQHLIKKWKSELYRPEFDRDRQRHGEPEQSISMTAAPTATAPTTAARTA